MREGDRGGVLRRKRTIVVPKIGWLLVLAARLFPAILHRLMMRLMPAPGGK